MLCELTLGGLRVEWHHNFGSHSPASGHTLLQLLDLMAGLHRVLGGARDGRLRHDRVGIGGFVDGFELQTLVMDPEIRRFQVFRRALVLV